MLPSFFEKKTRQVGEADAHLMRTRSTVEACNVRVTTPLGWVTYARQLEQTGVPASGPTSTTCPATRRRSWVTWSGW